MQTLEMIRRRLNNAHDVQSVVNAMKVLAVVSIRQFEKSLESLDGYYRTIELGLQALMLEPPPDLGRDFLAETEAGRAGARAGKGEHTCAIIFGSDQGLSGQFNERIAAFALGRLQEMGIEAWERKIVALGEHITYRLSAANEKVDRQFPIHGSVKTMKRTVWDLFGYIDGLRAARQCSQVLLFYHEPLTGAHNRPHMTRLLPIDTEILTELRERPWPSRSRPVFVTDWQTLLRSLIRHYLRVTIERAFVQSLLSENTSRLLAMQMAESNIADYLDDLHHKFNEQRQSEITAEILDIVASLEAVEATGGQAFI